MSKVLILLLVLGVMLVIFDDAVIILKEIAAKLKIFFKVSKESKVEKHLYKYVAVIKEDEKISGYIKNLISVSVILYVGSFIFFYSLIGAKAIFLSLIVSLGPYLYLRFKVVIAQRQGSFEGESLIIEIRAQYRINQKNMYYAIDETIKSIGDKIPFSKKALLRLSLKLKTFSSSAELSEILEEFAFSYDTEWSNLLAQNIYNYAFEGIDISAGLNDMVQMCKQINANREAKKRENAQSISIVKILCPSFFIGFVFLLLKMFEMKDIIAIQFFTWPGILLLFSIVLSFIAVIVITSLMKNQKYDL